MTLDRKSGQVLEMAEHDRGTSLDQAPMSCGRYRWYCVRTEPKRELLAHCELREQRFHSFLPMHLERPRIVPLFRRYLFVRLATGEPWGAITRTRGVDALISTASYPQPTAIAVGVVEDLIARTSMRGVVDDPADAPDPPPPPRQHWQSITTMSAKARNELLLRLFGQVDA